MPKMPPYCIHKPKGLAFVRIGHRQIYLGKAHSEESHQAYTRLIDEWRANGYHLPDPSCPEPQPLAELITAYYTSLTAMRYSPAHLNKIRRALRDLNDRYGPTPLAAFGPLQAKGLRESWITRGYTREYINELLQAVRTMFRWGVENELCEVETLQRLQAIAPLRSGRCDAPNKSRRDAVPWQHVKQTLRHASPILRAMILLQWWTGMRPGELVQLRPADIKRDGNAWTYAPQHHKNQHRGHTREIYLGPNARRILRPFLLRPADSPCFSPLENFRAAKREGAKGQRRTDATEPRKTTRRIGPAYSTRSYCKAITSTQEKHNLPTWTPHQLRHAAGTRFRHAATPDEAQILMGHETIDATEHYARIKRERGIEAATRLG